MAVTDGLSRNGSAPSAPVLERGEPKIVATDVERDFSGRRTNVQALGPFSLTIHDGEFICIVGPSGCGKSTFLRITAGLLNPTAGDVRIRPGASTGPATAMVFQEYGILPWKTVEQNVRLGLEIRGVRRGDSTAPVEKWLSRMGLADFAKSYPATLSGGMRQRVSIARALAVEPEILLMDEPFAALDAQLRLLLQEELLTIWEEDRRTVILVTHSLEEALLLGDRVVVMSARPGRMIGDFRVPFERPRSPELRSTREFAEMQQRIWDLLRSEVTSTMTSGMEEE
jgi:NitT/TauT family transport system ATP-binding protein